MQFFAFFCCEGSPECWVGATIESLNIEVEVFHFAVSLSGFSEFFFMIGCYFNKNILTVFSFQGWLPLDRRQRIFYVIFFSKISKMPCPGVTVSRTVFQKVAQIFVWGLLQMMKKRENTSLRNLASTGSSPVKKYKAGIGDLSEMFKNPLIIFL